MILKFLFVVIRHFPYYFKTYFFVLLPYSRHKDRYSLARRYDAVRDIVIHIFKHLKIDLKTYNMENLRNHKGGFIGVSNHRFTLDPIFYIFLNKEPISFVAKKEAKKIPIVGRTMRVIDCYFIDREDILNQVRLFKDICKHIEETKINYYIFPEGTRTKDKTSYHTLPYKSGSLKLAYWSKIDIIPFVLLNTENIFAKRKKGEKTVPVYIQCLKPIKYSEISNISTTIIMPKIEKESNEVLEKLNNIRSLCLMVHNR